jgi:hypothetical protein
VGISPRPKELGDFLGERALVLPVRWKSAWQKALTAQTLVHRLFIGSNDLAARHDLAYRLLSCWISAHLTSTVCGMEKHDDIEALSELILRYLDAHADAADTIEGIARWWVARQRYNESVAAVERAVGDLERRELLKRSILPDGRVLFSKR